MVATFSEIINSDTPTLVDFFAEWCGPCKTMKPILVELKTKVGNSVIILKIDIDKNPKISSKFNIKGVPTLILFRNGKIKWQQSGVVTAINLQKIINEFLV